MSDYNVWDYNDNDAAILAGAGLVTDTINNANTNYTNQKIAKENREFQKETSLEFYNLQNEYNKPSAQMARLEEAGINPFVAASKIANLNQAAELGLPTQSAIPWQSPQSFVGSFSQLAAAIAALSNAKHQDALTEDVKKSLSHKLKGMILDNERSEFELNSDKYFKNQERNLGLQQLRANIEKSWNEANLALEQGNVASMEYQLKNAQRYYYEMQGKMAYEQWLHYGEFIQAQIEELRTRSFANTEQGKAAQAAGVASMSQADLNNAIRTTEDALRDDKVLMGKLENGFKAAATYKEFVDAKFSLLNAVEDLEQKRIIGQEAKVILQSKIIDLQYQHRDRIYESTPFGLIGKVLNLNPARSVAK